MELSAQYIRTLKIDRSIDFNPEKYPYSIRSLRNLEELEFHSKVTFLTGENGSGKSTLLEALAVSLGMNAEGGSGHLRFKTKDTHSALYSHVKVVRGTKRPKDSYFLRAESFYNVATELQKIDEEVFPPKDSIKYHEFSHGESFFALVFERLKGNGLFLFDEPESALSPTRQLSFLSRIHDLCKMNSRLVIVTHSPILLSYPHATIYELSDAGIRKTSYEETEHFKVTRDFLNNYSKMLDILVED